MTISRADLDEGVVRFSSNLPGPHRLFLIGLHPDEAGNVWPSVLSQIEEELCFGMVTAVYCFPGFPLERAVGEEKEDPNRCFPPPDDGVMKSPLYRRLHTIQQYVDECDELVDFHRYNKDDGGTVAFSFDDEGTRFAQSIGIPRVVEELVWMVEGAVALYAHRSGKNTLVIEAGPNSRTQQTDESVLEVVSRLLRDSKQRERNSNPMGRDLWPEGPAVLRCVRPIYQSELSTEQLQELSHLAHLGTLSESMERALDLEKSTRFLLINPESDPVAFACVEIK